MDFSRLFNGTATRPCKCADYKDLETRRELNKRGRQTKKIIAWVELIAEDSSGEHKLYRCPACSQLWQRSLDWMRGNSAYAFKVPAIDIATWIGQPFVQPDELFNRVGMIEQYLEKACFEEKAQLCRREGCNERAIKLSVLCALHHMESIGLGNSLPENCTWFRPYEPEDYMLTMRYLKSLPNYSVFHLA